MLSEHSHERINVILIFCTFSLIIGDENIETPAICRIAIWSLQQQFISSNIEFEISNVPKKFLNRTLVKLSPKEMSSVTNLGAVVKSSWTRNKEWKVKENGRERKWKREERTRELEQMQIILPANVR